jgi:hypothetical protein
MAKNINYYGRRDSHRPPRTYRRPPMPTPEMRNQCNLHGYPWKYDCPSCDLNNESDQDFAALLEVLDGDF